MSASSSAITTRRVGVAEVAAEAGVASAAGPDMAITLSAVATDAEATSTGPGPLHARAYAPPRLSPVPLPVLVPRPRGGTGQTRRTQNPVTSRSCGFESHRGYPNFVDLEQHTCDSPG